MLYTLSLEYVKLDVGVICFVRCHGVQFQVPSTAMWIIIWNNCKNAERRLIRFDPRQSARLLFTWLHYENKLFTVSQNGQYNL